MGQKYPIRSLTQHHRLLPTPGTEKGEITRLPQTFFQVQSCMTPFIGCQRVRLVLHAFPVLS
jgi:hypothetical protein